LTPEAIETVLAEFRSWLEQLPAAAAHAPAPEGEPIDLHTLLGQFTGLRHEVNLQTRAVRAQQEQNAETLRRLDDALEELRDVRDTGRLEQEQASGEALRPLLKTLVELYDSLALARRELQRVQETVLPVLAELATDSEAPPPDSVPSGPPAYHAEMQLRQRDYDDEELQPSAPPVRRADRPSFWSRLFGTRPAEPGDTGRETLERTIATQQQQLQALRERDCRAAGAGRRAHEFLDSVITGYTMSLQRVERALQQHGLEAIATVGHPFDPEEMEVLEAVSNSGRPANEVLDEIRRGYVWRGRVFRFAQVRVARS
jgi:molecular chaperone GrpE